MIRKQNRLLTALLAAALLALPTGAWAADGTVPEDPALPAAQPQLAEVKVSREQAVAIAHRTFTIPAELGEPNAGISQDADRAVWSLRWQSDEKKPDQIYINVYIDAVNGRVVGYSTWSTGPESQALSYTRDEALAIARDWFQKLVPEELRPALRFVDTGMAARYYGGATYQFHWERVEQGYPVMDEGVSITVDARNGSLTDYSLTWSEGRSFAAPGSVLSREKAEAALRPHLGMTLQYRYYTKRGTDEGEWRLVYAPRTGLPYVDQEGRLLDYNGRVAQPNPEPRLLDSPQKPYRTPTSPLDREAALAIAAAATGITAPPASSSYDETGTDVKRHEWSFSWRTDGVETYATVDARAGVLTSLYTWSRDDESLREGEEPPVSRAEAEARAIAFVQNNRPDLAGRILYLPQPERDDMYRKPVSYDFHFVQLQNGLPVDGRDLSVEIDARTGAVRWYSAYTEVPGKDDFPAAEGAISADKALDAYLEAKGIRLAWVTLWDPDREERRQPQLLWASDDVLPLSAIDARTGAPLDWEGRDLIAAARRPTDIAGHFAEREIELLWSRGVLELEDGRFRPDELATAAELARWIVLAKGIQPYPAADFRGMGAGSALALQLEASKDSPYFGAAFRAGIMRPEDFTEGVDLNGPVSRELFALWAVRAMAYTRVAEMEARIALPFADAEQVGAKYHNAVALLAGFGIISGDAENRYHPQAEITRGAAAQILYAVSAEPRY